MANPSGKLLKSKDRGSPVGTATSNLLEISMMKLERPQALQRDVVGSGPILSLLFNILPFDLESVAIDNFERSDGLFGLTYTTLRNPSTVALDRSRVLRTSIIGRSKNL
jgi:hypothetical protein